MSLGAGMSPIRSGGGHPPVGAAGQLPAAFVDGPVVGPADQDQVGQVGGGRCSANAIDGGLRTRPGAGAAGEHTAAVAGGQGGLVGGLDDRGGPAMSRGWVGAAQGRGQQGHGRPQPPFQPAGRWGLIRVVGDWPGLGARAAAGMGLAVGVAGAVGLGAGRAEPTLGPPCQASAWARTIPGRTHRASQRHGARTTPTPPPPATARAPNDPRPTAAAYGAGPKRPRARPSGLPPSRRRR
jgi:hypothetical protein